MFSVLEFPRLEKMFGYSCTHTSLISTSKVAQVVKHCGYACKYARMWKSIIITQSKSFATALAMTTDVTPSL